MKAVDPLIFTSNPRMSSYAPGTTFRIYTNDSPSISFPTTGSKHYTAVLLKDGQVLEVKNPDTGKKETFPSLTEWCNARGVTENDVKVDSSKGSGIVVGSDTNGFNYPTERGSSYTWVKWLYQMVGEGAPQLLKSEEFKTLYNQMVELCNKHKQELRHWDYNFSGKSRYSPQNLKNNYISAKWTSYPGYFYNENYTFGQKRYSAAEYDAARGEIVKVYKKICYIVEPLISDYMTKKHNILTTQRKIAQSNAAIKRLEKKAEQLQNSIKWNKSYIANEQANLAKYEGELIVAQMKAL